MTNFLTFNLIEMLEFGKQNVKEVLWMSNIPPTQKLKTIPECLNCRKHTLTKKLILR